MNDFRVHFIVSRDKRTHKQQAHTQRSNRIIEILWVGKTPKVNRNDRVSKEGNRMCFVCMIRSSILTSIKILKTMEMYLLAHTRQQQQQRQQHQQDYMNRYCAVAPASQTFQRWQNTQLSAATILWLTSLQHDYFLVFYTEQPDSIMCGARMTLANWIQSRLATKWLQTKTSDRTIKSNRSSRLFFRSIHEIEHETYLTWSALQKQ